LINHKVHKAYQAYKSNSLCLLVKKRCALWG
jgi:hypothetical protein